MTLTKPQISYDEEEQNNSYWAPATYGALLQVKAIYDQVNGADASYLNGDMFYLKTNSVAESQIVILPYKNLDHALEGF